jgi:hypothetical protein
VIDQILFTTSSIRSGRNSWPPRTVKCATRRGGCIFVGGLAIPQRHDPPCVVRSSGSSDLPVRRGSNRCTGRPKGETAVPWGWDPTYAYVQPYRCLNVSSRSPTPWTPAPQSIDASQLACAADNCSSAIFF